MPLQSFGQAINVAIVGASGGIGSAFLRQLADDPSVANILALSRSQQVFDLPAVDTASVDLADPESDPHLESSESGIPNVPQV